MSVWADTVVVFLNNQHLLCGYADTVVVFPNNQHLLCGYADTVVVFSSTKIYFLAVQILWW